MQPEPANSRGHTQSQPQLQLQMLHENEYSASAHVFDSISDHPLPVSSSLPLDRFHEVSIDDSSARQNNENSSSREFNNSININQYSAQAEADTDTGSASVSGSSSSSSVSGSPLPPSFRPVLLFLFLQGFCIGISLLLIPSLFLSLFDGDSSRSAFFLGVSGAVASALQFFSNPIFARASELKGRKPFLLIAVSAWLSIAAILAVAPSIPSLILATLMRGFDCGLTISSLIVTDVGSRVRFVDLNGRIASSLATGFLLGPIFAILIGFVDSFRLPFFCAALFLVFNFIFVTRRFKETNPTNSRSSPFCSASFFVCSSPLRWPRNVIYLSICSFISIFNLVGLASIFYLFLHEKHGWGATENGIFLFLFALAAILAQIILLPQLAKPGSFLTRNGISEGKLVSIGIVCGFTQLFFLAFIPPSASIILFFVPAFVWPSFVLSTIIRGSVSRLVDSQSQSALQGCLGSLNALAGILAPILFSSSFAYFVRSDAAVYLPEFPFLLSIATLIVMTMFLRLVYLSPEFAARQYSEIGENDNEHEHEENGARSLHEQEMIEISDERRQNGTEKLLENTGNSNSSSNSNIVI